MFTFSIKKMPRVPNMGLDSNENLEMHDIAEDILGCMLYATPGLT